MHIPMGHRVHELNIISCVECVPLEIMYFELCITSCVHNVVLENKLIICNVAVYLLQTTPCIFHENQMMTVTLALLPVANRWCSDYDTQSACWCLQAWGLVLHGKFQFSSSWLNKSQQLPILWWIMLYHGKYVQLNSTHKKSIIKVCWNFGSHLGWIQLTCWKKDNKV